MNIRVIPALLLPLSICFLTACTAIRHPHQSALQAGAAEVDITPPVGHRMAGYFDERVSTGMHDPLLAKAVILQHGNQRIAFVFCDLIALSKNVTSVAREQASRATGIPAQNIMICATHSHTGPLFDDVRRDYFHKTAIAQTGTDSKESIFYPTFLQERILSALTNAQAKLKPVNLSVGEGTLVGFSFNRRYYMTNGTVRTNPGLKNPAIIGPAGPVDPSVPVILAEDPATGAPLFSIASFACHCDTCGGTQYSGDYPRYLADALRHDLGPELISAFALGTAGDINHIDIGNANALKGYANSERIGTNLAKAVLAARRKAITAPNLAAVSKVVVLPLQQVTPEEARVASANLGSIARPEMPFLEKVRTTRIADLGTKGSESPLEVQAFRLDKDTAVVCLPSEIFVELGLEIKRHSPFPRTIVFSLCNDRLGYVPTAKAYKEGGYEVENSRLAPGGGEKLAETAIQLLRNLKPR